MSITVLDLALYRGAKEDEDHTINGGEFERVGLPMMGGCKTCGASIAAYNACPAKDGYLRCESCIGKNGWETAHLANEDLFGGKQP